MDNSSNLPNFPSHQTFPLYNIYFIATGDWKWWNTCYLSPGLWEWVQTRHSLMHACVHTCAFMHAYPCIHTLLIDWISPPNLKFLTRCMLVEDRYTYDCIFLEVSVCACVPQWLLIPSCMMWRDMYPNDWNKLYKFYKAAVVSTISR